MKWFPNEPLFDTVCCEITLKHFRVPCEEILDWISVQRIYRISPKIRADFRNIELVIPAHFIFLD